MKDNPSIKDPDKKNFHLQEIQIPDDILGGTIGRNGIKLGEIRYFLLGILSYKFSNSFFSEYLSPTLKLVLSVS